jgi:hypothetical protein
MRRATTRIVLVFAAIQFCLISLLWSQTPQIGQNFASMIYLDGKNVVENAQFPVNKDQFLSLETYDLQPNSSVELITQQNGFPLVKKVYQTNERGAMKDILFFPKAKANIKCVVRFITLNGQEKRIVFHIKPV